MLTLAKEALSIPLVMSMSEAFSVPFFTLIKLCYTHTHTHSVTCFLQISGFFFFSTIQFILRLWMVLLSSFCFPQILLSCLTKWYQTHGFWNATNLCIYSSMHSHSVVSNCCNYGLQPARLLCPWDFPGKNTEVGCHFLLQGNFPTQGLKLGLAGRFFTIWAGSKGEQSRNERGREIREGKRKWYW